MKRSLSFLAIQLLAITAIAETPNGFADIPFGAPLKQAQAAIAGREGLKPASNTPERLTFTGGTFAGQPVSLWTLDFAGGKFASGSVRIENIKKPVYDDLKAQLTRKYGKPDSEKGHHSWECLWEFRSDGRRTVRLDFEHQGRVNVTYFHDGIARGAPAAKKSDL